ncbi:hypothetical protein M8J77_023632 [Diaphorina citri]|nr:hypothetical protein M8J77_023632 [Diaphorina citri]
MLVFKEVIVRPGLEIFLLNKYSKYIKTPSLKEETTLKYEDNKDAVNKDGGGGGGEEEEEKEEEEEDTQS